LFRRERTKSLHGLILALCAVGRRNA
jgi:hypothetical protein